MIKNKENNNNYRAKEGQIKKDTERKKRKKKTLNPEDLTLDIKSVRMIAMLMRLKRKLQNLNKNLKQQKKMVMMLIKDKNGAI